MAPPEPPHPTFSPQGRRSETPCVPDAATHLHPYLTEIDARSELRVHCLGAAVRRYFDHVFARTLVELVELEIPVTVAGGLRDQAAVLEQSYAGALDAVDDAVCLRRDAAADETFRIAPQIAVVDPRLAGELGPHDFEALLAHHA